MRAMKFHRQGVPILSSVLFLVLAAACGFCAAREDGLQEEFPACRYCRMAGKPFACSRMVVGYADGTESALCSIHCMALDLVIKGDRTPRSIMVADYRTGALIDAETARWVLGGVKKGVMTERAKWAFASETDAEEFVGQYGGELASFEKALEAAFHDMHTDSKVIRNKRKLRKMIESLDTRAASPPKRSPCCGR